MVCFFHVGCVIRWAKSWVSWRTFCDQYKGTHVSLLPASLSPCPFPNTLLLSVHVCSLPFLSATQAPASYCCLAHLLSGLLSAWLPCLWPPGLPSSTVCLPIAHSFSYSHKFHEGLPPPPACKMPALFVSILPLTVSSEELE